MNVKDYVQKALTQIREAAPAGQAGGYQLEVDFDLAVDEDNSGDLYVYRGDGGSRIRFKAKIDVAS